MGVCIFCIGFEYFILPPKSIERVVNKKSCDSCLFFPDLKKRGKGENI